MIFPHFKCMFTSAKYATRPPTYVSFSDPCFTSRRQQMVSSPRQLDADTAGLKTFFCTTTAHLFYCPTRSYISVTPCLPKTQVFIHILHITLYLMSISLLLNFRSFENALSNHGAALKVVYKRGR